MGHENGPGERDKVEAQIRVPQQRRAVDTPMSKWAGEGKDWIQLMAQGPARKDDVPDAYDDETAGGEGNAERGRGRLPEGKGKKTGSVGTRRTRRGQTLMFEIRWNTMTIVEWINGHAKQKKSGKASLQPPRIS